MSLSSTHTRAEGSPRRWLIYVLSDPRNGEVRYVGKALEQKGHRQTYEAIASHRLATHLYYARKKTGSYRLHWIRSLLEAGIEPVMTLIVTREGIGCSDMEKFCVAACRFWGFRLTNATEGGEGSPGRSLSDEAKARIGAANSKRRGWKHSEETKAKIGKAHKGRVLTPEHRDKLASSMRGRKLPPEQVAKSATTHRGQKRSDETKAKISAALQGRKLSDEHRAKLRAHRKINPSPRQPDGKFGPPKKKRGVMAVLFDKGVVTPITEAS